MPYRLSLCIALLLFASHLVSSTELHVVQWYLQTELPQCAEVHPSQLGNTSHLSVSLSGTQRLLGTSLMNANGDSSQANPGTLWTTTHNRETSCRSVPPNVARRFSAFVTFTPLETTSRFGPEVLCVIGGASALPAAYSIPDLNGPITPSNEVYCSSDGGASWAAQPPLPFGIAFGSATAVGDTIYVFAGDYSDEDPAVLSSALNRSAGCAAGNSGGFGNVTAWPDPGGPVWAARWLNTGPSSTQQAAGSLSAWSWVAHATPAGRRRGAALHYSRATRRLHLMSGHTYRPSLGTYSRWNTGHWSLDPYGPTDDCMNWYRHAELVQNILPWISPTMSRPWGLRMLDMLRLPGTGFVMIPPGYGLPRLSLAYYGSDSTLLPDVGQIGMYDLPDLRQAMTDAGQPPTYQSNGAPVLDLQQWLAYSDGHRICTVDASAADGRNIDTAWRCLGHETWPLESPDQDTYTDEYPHAGVGLVPLPPEASEPGRIPAIHGPTERAVLAGFGTEPAVPNIREDYATRPFIGYFSDVRCNVPCTETDTSADAVNDATRIIDGSAVVTASQYSTGCTAHPWDATCSACNPCVDGQYQTVACGEIGPAGTMRNAVCRACSKCAEGYAPLNTCQGKQDTQCGAVLPITIVTLDPYISGRGGRDPSNLMLALLGLGLLTVLMACVRRCGPPRWRPRWGIVKFSLRLFLLWLSACQLIFAVGTVVTFRDMSSLLKWQAAEALAPQPEVVLKTETYAWAILIMYLAPLLMNMIFSYIYSPRMLAHAQRRLDRFAIEAAQAEANFLSSMQAAAAASLQRQQARPRQATRQELQQQYLQQLEEASGGPALDTGQSSGAAGMAGPDGLATRPTVGLSPLSADNSAASGHSDTTVPMDGLPSGSRTGSPLATSETASSRRGASSAHDGPGTSGARFTGADASAAAFIGVDVSGADSTTASGTPGSMMTTSPCFKLGSTYHYDDQGRHVPYTMEKPYSPLYTRNFGYSVPVYAPSAYTSYSPYRGGAGGGGEGAGDDDGDSQLRAGAKGKAGRPRPKKGHKVAQPADQPQLDNQDDDLSPEDVWRLQWAAMQPPEPILSVPRLEKLRVRLLVLGAALHPRIVLTLSRRAVDDITGRTTAQQLALQMISSAGAGAGAGVGAAGAADDHGAGATADSEQYGPDEAFEGYGGDALVRENPLRAARAAAAAATNAAAAQAAGAGPDGPGSDDVEATAAGADNSSSGTALSLNTLHMPGGAVVTSPSPTSSPSSASAASAATAPFDPNAKFGNRLALCLPRSARYRLNLGRAARRLTAFELLVFELPCMILMASAALHFRYLAGRTFDMQEPPGALVTAAQRSRVFILVPPAVTSVPAFAAGLAAISFFVSVGTAFWTSVGTSNMQLRAKTLFEDVWGEAEMIAEAQGRGQRGAGGTGHSRGHAAGDAWMAPDDDDVDRDDDAEAAVDGQGDAEGDDQGDDDDEEGDGHDGHDGHGHDEHGGDTTSQASSRAAAGTGMAPESGVASVEPLSSLPAVAGGYRAAGGIGAAGYDSAHIATASQESTGAYGPDCPGPYVMSPSPLGSATGPQAVSEQLGMAILGSQQDWAAYVQQQYSQYSQAYQGWYGHSPEADGWTLEAFGQHLLQQLQAQHAGQNPQAQMLLQQQRQGRFVGGPGYCQQYVPQGLGVLEPVPEREEQPDGEQDGEEHEHDQDHGRDRGRGGDEQHDADAAPRVDGAPAPPPPPPPPPPVVSKPAQAAARPHSRAAVVSRMSRPSP